MNTALKNYLSWHLGYDFASVPAGAPLVVASKTRCRRLKLYGSPWPVLVLSVGDRCAVSARHDLVEAVRGCFARQTAPCSTGPAAGQRLVDICREHLPKRLAPRGWQFSRALLFTCQRPGGVLRVPGAAVVDGAASAGLPVARGIYMKDPFRQLGKAADACRSVVYRGRIVAVAYTIFDGHEGVGYVAVETAPAFRRRGFGKLCLAALTNDLIKAGRVALYVTNHENTASIGLARGVGYRLLGRRLTVNPA